MVTVCDNLDISVRHLLEVFGKLERAVVDQSYPCTNMPIRGCVAFPDNLEIGYDGISEQTLFYCCQVFKDAH